MSSHILANKKIILGISASIAAYKCAHLCRLLVKAGAEVQVIFTPSAKEFVTPLTFATLSHRPVLSDFVKNDMGEWNHHVNLGLWADAILIAPASANTLAKMANGFCDNLLLATYLSARCPVFFAPAMDLDMFEHQSVVSNIKKLCTFPKHHLIDANFGELASGLIGKGRMAEAEEIVDFLTAFFAQKNRFVGKKVVITAGPTREAIDPVRFISNHSTGKMGFALANAFAAEGAEVVLVSGTTENHTLLSNVKKINVESAEQMFDKVRENGDSADIFVFAAAVADYRPKEIAKEKIKKKDDEMQIELVKNVDIAFEMGKIKRENQFSVGFALETHQELENAKIKLAKKNFDMVVLNSLQDKGAGFAHDTNKITIVDKNGIQSFALKSKNEVAADILNAISKKMI